MWKLKRLAQLVPAQVKLSDDACFRLGVINHVEIRTSHLCQLKALSDGAAFAALPFVGSWPIAARHLRMAERRFRRKAEMALSSLPCAASRRLGPSMSTTMHASS
jgi:hypothetical protein